MDEFEAKNFKFIIFIFQVISAFQIRSNTKSFQILLYDTSLNLNPFIQLQHKCQSLNRKAINICHLTELMIKYILIKTIASNYCTSPILRISELLFLSFMRV